MCLLPRSIFGGEVAFVSTTCSCQLVDSKEWVAICANLRYYCFVMVNVWVARCDLIFVHCCFMLPDK